MSTTKKKAAPRKRKVAEPPAEAQAEQRPSQEPQECASPYVAPDPKSTEPCVLLNAHRNTCIRVSVGRSNVTYIPLDQEGIMVRKAGIDSFYAEWGLYLPGQDVRNSATRFLLSYQALRHISGEARTLLEEIAVQGATFKSTTKENHMNTTVTKPAAESKSKGFDKKAAAAGYAAAVGNGKTPGKGGDKAPSKTTSKAVKPAAKPAKASTSKAAKAEKYAGKTIKTLFKVEEVAAREGTWTRFMVLAAIKAKTTDAAQNTVDASKDFAGRTVDFKWLVDKGYISIK